MKTKKAPRFTRDQMVQKLRDGIAAITTEDAFRRFLDIKRKMHNYSLRNCMMIGMQYPTATLVRGFNDWKKHGRFVKKGEKGIAIFAPLIVSKKKADKDGETEGRCYGFRIVYVFDVAQTDGEPIKAGADYVQTLAGEGNAAAFHALIDWLEAEGIAVTDGPIPEAPAANGVYRREEKSITLNADLPLSPAQRLKTLIHEAAHYILHTDPKVREKINRPIAETEAEATAYLVMAALGLDAGEYSFGYVADWSAGDPKILEGSLSRINKAADRLGAVVTAAAAAVDAESPAA